MNIKLTTWHSMLARYGDWPAAAFGGFRENGLVSRESAIRSP